MRRAYRNTWNMWALWGITRVIYLILYRKVSVPVVIYIIRSFVQLLVANKTNGLFYNNFDQLELSWQRTKYMWIILDQQKVSHISRLTIKYVGYKMHTINVMTYIYYPSLAYHTLSLVLGLVSQTILSLCVVSRLQVKLMAMATLSDFLRSWSRYSFKSRHHFM